MDKQNRLKINDEGFAFDEATGNSYTVNDSARRIIRGIESGEETVVIARSLMEKYLVAQTTAERDVRDVRSRLRSWGLYLARALKVGAA